jgi:hypothetical protein
MKRIVCAKRGCRTVLNSYNATGLCSIHQSAIERHKAGIDRLKDMTDDDNASPPRVHFTRDYLCARQKCGRSKTNS